MEAEGQLFFFLKTIIFSCGESKGHYNNFFLLHHILLCMNESPDVKIASIKKGCISLLSQTDVSCCMSYFKTWRSQSRPQSVFVYFLFFRFWCNHDNILHFDSYSLAVLCVSSVAMI